MLSPCTQALHEIKRRAHDCMYFGNEAFTRDLAQVCILYTQSRGLTWHFLSSIFLLGTASTSLLLSDLASMNSNEFMHRGYWPYTLLSRLSLFPSCLQHRLLFGRTCLK